MSISVCICLSVYLNLSVSMYPCLALSLSSSWNSLSWSCGVLRRETGKRKRQIRGCPRGGWGSTDSIHAVALVTRLEREREGAVGLLALLLPGGGGGGQRRSAGEKEAMERRRIFFTVGQGHMTSTTGACV